MPSATGTEKITGNEGNGRAKITVVENFSAKIASVNSGYEDLDSIFDRTITEYRVSLPASAVEFKLNATPVYASTTITGDINYSLHYGLNTLKLLATGRNGETDTYTFDIFVEVGDDALKLSSFVSDEYVGALTPEFDPNVLEYEYEAHIKDFQTYWVYTTNVAGTTVTVEKHEDPKNKNAGNVTLTLTHDGYKETIYRFNYTVDGEFTTTFEYTGKYQTFTATRAGYYKIELWGAQGNNNPNEKYIGGRGAYTKGTVYLDKGTNIYIYVGQHRTDSGTNTSWNAGSTGGTSAETYNNVSTVNGYGGGGSTDVRLVPTSTETAWRETESLASRIMVAAGGGGASSYNYGANGGSGGTLIGKSGISNGCPGYVKNIPSTGGTQTTGGTAGKTGGSNAFYAGSTGTFGAGGNSHANWGSGGGGGYWGGFGGGYSSCVVVVLHISLVM